MLFRSSERPHVDVVAVGRYELYSNYALKIQAVAASIPQRDDALGNAVRS